GARFHTDSPGTWEASRLLSHEIRYGTPDRKGPGPSGDGCPGSGNERASSGEVLRRRGRPETAGTGGAEADDPHRSGEDGELARAGTHWREGGEQTDALVEGDMPVRRDRARMFTEL